MKAIGAYSRFAVLGDARVGKSTTLNIITFVWTEMSRGQLEIQEIFETGNSPARVTRGVWAHITRVKSEGINVVLLDVEGTDLGDDSENDNFSMFTVVRVSHVRKQYCWKQRSALPVSRITIKRSCVPKHPSRQLSETSNCDTKPIGGTRH